MDLEMQTTRNRLLIAATNFDEFNNLCEQAQQEAAQLQQTLRRLSCFDFEFQLSVESGKRAASNTVRIGGKEL